MAELSLGLPKFIRSSPGLLYKIFTLEQGKHNKFNIIGTKGGAKKVLFTGQRLPPLVGLRYIFFIIIKKIMSPPPPWQKSQYFFFTKIAHNILKHTINT